MPRISATNLDLPADVLAACERSAQRYGSLPLNHAVLARTPSIFRAFRAMWDGLEASALLPARLVDLVNLRVASLIGCRLCVELNSAWSRAHGITETELAELANAASSTTFSARERAALAYAESIATSDSVRDELFATVRLQFSEEEIIELTATITFEVCVAKFNRALEIEGQGICEIRNPPAIA